MIVFFSKSGLVCDFEDFDFLHCEILQTRENLPPIPAGVVRVTVAKRTVTAEKVTAGTDGVSVAVIENTHVITKGRTYLGITIDCFVLLFGLQRKFSRREILRILQRKKKTLHNITTDCWVIIKRQVYDVISYLEMHPVSPHCILQFAGHDMTRAFKRTHGNLSLDVISKLCIGRDFVVNHFVICRVTIHCTCPFPYLIVSGAFVRIPDRILDLSLFPSMRSP
jgi:hypothetical protein